MKPLVEVKMPKKSRIDKQIEKEEKEYNFRRGLAAMQEP
jgi:hypothetical protein